jgi:pimeloyl-ACP methyl ester carboxylesterase
VQEKYIQNDVYYREYGSGDDVIVLIHGFLASSKYWNRIRPSLVRAGYRVILIDLLGFGNANKPDHIEYSYSDQVRYVDKVMNYLSIGQFNLVGHSMGALIAARYAALYPIKVNALVLLHPPMYIDTEQAVETLLNTSFMYRHLLMSKYRNSMWKLMRYAFPAIIADHTHYAREKSLRNIVTKAELFTDLKNIKTRTIILVGLKDRSIYQNNLSNISLNPLLKVTNENVDHHSPVKHPVLIKGIILNFISSDT